MTGLDTITTPLEALTGRKTKRRLTKEGKKKNKETLARTPLRSPHRWKTR